MAIGNINHLEFQVVIVPSHVQSEERQAALAQVRQNGWALRDVSASLRNDREVVLAAVTQNAWALQFASDELKNDREIVLAAVTREGYAFQYASASLRNDREIVLAAVTQNRAALVYASPERRAEFESPEYADIVEELNGRNRFKAAVTDKELKRFELSTFGSALQPFITAWLYRLSMTKTFKYPLSASALANRVYTIFAYAQENPKFAVKLRKELRCARMSCSDSSFVIYHTLSTTKKLMQVFTKSVPEIIELCHGLYKLSLLEIQAFKRFQEIGEDGDQISIALGFQMRLRAEFSLPLDFYEVRFAKEWTGLTDAAVQTAREFVEESLKDDAGFVHYLLDLKPWQKYLLETKDDVKAKHTEIIHHFGDQLDELMDKAGTMTSEEYRMQVDAIVNNRAQAFGKLFEDATRQIVETVGLSSSEGSSSDFSARASSSGQ